jgi:L-seryl-tRNA(Ser) seleniumtransferase
MDHYNQPQLRQLPGVDHILELAQSEPFFKDIPRTVLTQSIRRVLDRLRHRILGHDVELSASELSDAAVLRAVKELAQLANTPNLLRTINATGVVVHTNLGRSLLAPEAVENVVRIGSRYSNLEYNLAAGKRGSRYSAVEGLLCEITRAEAALVVNNNAGAVLLALESIARGHNVIVSRGELVEIGGSFRIPDVMAKSGCTLREVGTTNRTHLRDYEDAIDEQTALLLKVHQSNYSIVGFSKQVSLKEMVSLGNRHQLPVMEDLGSGTFIDFSKYGLSKEPTVQESVAAGVDVITFSGDKLLGGPQAGVILGRQDLIDRIKKNPITRALRIDKLTLAAFESTLRLYREERTALEKIPTLAMITRSIQEIENRTADLKMQLTRLADRRLHLQEIEGVSKAGGGSLPLLELPSRCLGIHIDGFSANQIEVKMRSSAPPIIGRIENQLFRVDLRTVLPDEIPLIVSAVENILKRKDS